VHSKLLYKLKMCGIRGKLLLWVAAFLSNRTQYVKVGSVYSDTAQVISGVPQGCVLGPVLFLLYINDIVMNFDQRITLKLFADDVKIYVVINDLDDCILLQRGLDRIVHWADTWQLSISITKSAVIHFGNNNKLAYSYAIGDSVLPTVDNIRDLGVTVDCKLRFNIHINNIVKRAHQRAALISRCFKTRDPTTLWRAFTTYVRPVLEYCSPVWSTTYITDIRKIEAVQRRFTKRLQGFDLLPYTERLRRLNADSLELRRLKADLLTVYKIRHGLLSVDIEYLTVQTENKFGLRRHAHRLFRPAIKSNCLANSFTCRVITAWNFLPSCIVDASSPFMCNKLLSTVDLRRFLCL